MNYSEAEPSEYQTEKVLKIYENHPFSNFPINTCDAERRRILTIKSAQMKYSIPEKRELNFQEVEILNYLFSQEKPEWVSLLPKLKVIARCGCGECPTIFLGQTYDSEIQTGSVMIDYESRDQDGNLIGVSVFATKTEPTQLEFYSVDGDAKKVTIPEISTLKRANP